MSKLKILKWIFLNKYSYFNDLKDIVVLKDLKTPLIIFPLKFPISNYKQNRNNYWENLCGECFQMKIKKFYRAFELFKSLENKKCL